MYSLKYKVTTSTCDSKGRLKLYSALQMMQDCSEMWIDSEPEVKDYFLQQNMAQLLATRQVEIVRVPEFKEELTVTTSVYADNTVYFQEAKLVLICKKVYAAEIQPSGIIYQETIDQSYPQGDFHTMYVGKIEKILVRDDEYLG